MEASKRLWRLRDAMDAINRRTEELDPFGENDDIREAVQRFEELDEWLRAGNPLPPDWKRLDS